MNPTPFDRAVESFFKAICELAGHDFVAVTDGGPGICRRCYLGAWGTEATA